MLCAYCLHVLCVVFSLCYVSMRARLASLAFARFARVARFARCGRFAPAGPPAAAAAAAENDDIQGKSIYFFQHAQCKSKIWHRPIKSGTVKTDNGWLLPFRANS